MVHIWYQSSTAIFDSNQQQTKLSKGFDQMWTGPVYMPTFRRGRAILMYVHFGHLQEMPFCVQISFVFYCFKVQ